MKPNLTNPELILSVQPRSHPDVAKGPIFIVGPSRSGTEMVRSVLNRHSALYVLGETHYFDDLRLRAAGGGRKVLSRGALRGIAERLSATRHRAYGLQGTATESDISPEELVELGLGEGTGDAVFKAFGRLAAARAGKPYWAEKTPRHIFRLDDISAAFPHSRFICLLRDVRASMASYRDWRNRWFVGHHLSPDLADQIRAEERRVRASYNPIIFCLLWRAAINLAEQAVTRYGAARVLILRYEDVLAAPISSVNRICDFLGIASEADMLNVPMANSSYHDFAACIGISSAPGERWKCTLTAREVAVAETLCGDLLEKFGYELLGGGNGLVWTSVELARLPLAVLRAAYVNRNRIGHWPSYIRDRLAAALSR